MKPLVIEHAKVVTPLGREAVKGELMGKLNVIEDATIVLTRGRISYVGSASNATFYRRREVNLINAKGRVVLPGFVDSHTHMIFDGYRAGEFAMRLRGATYMEIMNAGGGIRSSMTRTRQAKAKKMAEQAQIFIDKMSAMGVTTVEAKSGYGLDFETEMRMLKVINGLRKKKQKLDIVPTFLGAHAVPPEFQGRTSEYVDYLIHEALPAFKDLAKFCDVFCEKDVFEIEDSRRLLEAARKEGYQLKLHADEIVTLGGGELAGELKAVSADHLLHVSDAGIKSMAENGTIATLLPLTAFALKEPYAPARKFIDAGAAVALATDLNPGSCFSGSIPLMIALACIYMQMTIEEVITALTLNGAAAVGMADEIGSIEIGKRGDLVMLDYDDINMLPYYVGMNCVNTTIHEGRIVTEN